MNITPALARSTLGYAKEMVGRAVVQAATDARKKAVEADKLEALGNPRFKASDAVKQQARARVQDISDRLKILKKLYAMNPKEMAKALAQAFKELKQAVKDYKGAMGDEFKLAGEVASAAGEPDPKDVEGDGKVKDAEAANAELAAETEGDEARAAPKEAPTEAEAKTGRSLYDAVVGEVRKAIGEDGLDFMKSLRGLVKQMKEILDASRKQTMIQKPDKDTEKAFEDADKGAKSLLEDLESLTNDIRIAAPDAGMRLSVAA